MRSIRRELERSVELAARSFPSVVLTGPRRTGKTWLLRHLVPGASYVLLEDPTVVAALRRRQAPLRPSRRGRAVAWQDFVRQLRRPAW